MARSTALVAATALALAAAAPAPQVASAVGEPSAERQCFRPQTVRNYRTQHDTTAYVRDLRGQVFELQTTGCRGLSASRTLAISPQTGGAACVACRTQLWLLWAVTTSTSHRGASNVSRLSTQTRSGW